MSLRIPSLNVGFPLYPEFKWFPNKFSKSSLYVLPIEWFEIENVASNLISKSFFRFVRLLFVEHILSRGWVTFFSLKRSLHVALLKHFLILYLLLPRVYQVIFRRFPMSKIHTHCHFFKYISGQQDAHPKPLQFWIFLSSQDIWILCNTILLSKITSTRCCLITAFWDRRFTI